jgi:hypothetical protein
MEQFVPLISEVGFPIVVTLYLLYRIESKLDLVVQSSKIYLSGLRKERKDNRGNSLINRLSLLPSRLEDNFHLLNGRVL